MVRRAQALLLVLALSYSFPFYPLITTIHFQSGKSLADIAKSNERPIQVTTIIGYLCDAAAAGTAMDLSR